MPRVWEEEAAVDAVGGVAVVAACRRCSCLIVGEEVVETVVFAKPMDGGGLVATPCDLSPPIEVPASCRHQGAEIDWLP